jgi:ABC-type uncharacterized transport system fused permease/ATPase subunit
MQLQWCTCANAMLYCLLHARIQYYALEASRDIDNPDQRIAEDVQAFTHVSLQFMITIITSVIDLVSHCCAQAHLYTSI